MARRATALLALAVTLAATLAMPASAYRRPGALRRVSVASDEKQGNTIPLQSGECGHDLFGPPSISASGRYIAFASNLDGLVDGDLVLASDVFVRDVVTGKTELISQSSRERKPELSDELKFMLANPAFRGGCAAQAVSVFPSISADGRYVAYQSSARGLVPDDTDDAVDVFLRDRKLGTTTRISVAPNGAQAEYKDVQVRWGSFRPSISASGRYIAFNSEATNLVSGDTNNAPDVFVLDRRTRKISRASVGTSGAQADYGGVWDRPSITPDGRYVAFATLATTLAAQDDQSYSDVFVRDRRRRTTELVSVSSHGAIGDFMDFLGTSEHTISANGRYVTFASSSGNLIPNDSNCCDAGRFFQGTYADIFVRDRTTDRTERVSISSDGGVQGDGHSGQNGATISSDGRYVAYSSLAASLSGPQDTGTARCSSGTTGDRNTCDEDVFVYDRVTGANQWVSRAPGGGEPACLRVVPTFWSWGGCGSTHPAISSGRHIAFLSLAENLADSPDTNLAEDIFVYDRGLAVGTGSGGGQKDPDEPTGPLPEVCLPEVGCLPPDAPREATGDGGDAALPSADLTALQVVQRSRPRDVFVRLDVARLPSSGEAAVAETGLLYGLAFSVDGVRHEIRAATVSPKSPARLGVFRCASLCTQVRSVAGGIGTIGDAVTFSVPTSVLDGATSVAAFSAVGTYETGAVHRLDALPLR